MSISLDVPRVLTQLLVVVPQVLALGPALFLYINDIQNTFSESVIRHFADDTNDRKLDTIEKTIESVINHELNTSDNKQ